MKRGLLPISASWLKLSFSGQNHRPDEEGIVAVSMFARRNTSSSQNHRPDEEGIVTQTVSTADVPT